VGRLFHGKSTCIWNRRPERSWLACGKDRGLNDWISEAERGRLMTPTQIGKARIIQRLGNMVLHENSASVWTIPIGVLSVSHSPFRVAEGLLQIHLLQKDDLFG
jgi:hypothetical protein